MFRLPGQSGLTISVTGTYTQMQNPRIIDFDQVINRRGTGSVKYDSAQERGFPEAALPLWVADMDFPAAPPILDALQERLNHGIFGYTEPQDGYHQAIIDWWREQHNYVVQRQWIMDSPGVIASMCAAVRAFTKPGDSVMVQSPVYAPFYNAVNYNDRKLVLCPLDYAEREYNIDFEAFRQAIETNEVKLFLLCSPHNPVGRVWTKLELEKIGTICLQNGVTIVSDEIHCDFAAPDHHHYVFAGLNRRFEQITVTLASPTKSFNLSGLQVSHVFIANDELRRAWIREARSMGMATPNIMGLIAGQAAYTEGLDWLGRLRAYVNGNDAFIREFLKQYLPSIHVVDRQGTYLLWLDCWGTGFTHAEMNTRLADRGKLWLYDGKEFGEDGEGFQRLNLAAPREILAEAMMRLSVAFSR